MHNFPFSRLIALAVVVAICGLSLIPNRSLHAAGQSTRLAGTGPNLLANYLNLIPKIDGSASVEEWGTPTEIVLNGFNDPSLTRTAQLYSGVTPTDLYIAIILTDPTTSSTDSAQIEFDSNHDGVANSDSDESVIFEATSVDQHWGISNWVSDAQQDGSGARVYTDGKYVYEFRKPLNSGDAQDMAVGLGSVLGFRIETWDAHTNEYYRYPANTRAHGDTSAEWTKWANLALAAEGVVSAPATGNPTNGTVLPAMTMLLNWSNPAATTQVHLQIIPSNNDGPGVNLILGNTTSFNVPPPPGWYGLLPGMGYTWRVRASAKPVFAPDNDPSWGPWSTNIIVRTPNRGSASISSLTPTNGATVSIDPRLLQWKSSDGDVFYYEIQVSSDKDFGEQGAFASVWQNLVHGGVTNPANSWVTPGLTARTTYYWRVRPRIQGDGTPVAWSEAWIFKTS